MNAKDFYEAFKDCLNFVGVGFNGMEDAEIDIKGQTVEVVSSETGRKAVLHVPITTQEAQAEYQLMRGIVEQVAAELPHTIPGGSCKCSRCTLVHEARAALNSAP